MSLQKEKSGLSVKRHQVEFKLSESRLKAFLVYKS